MPAYANKHGGSGVIWWVAGDDWISVTFVGGRTYLYSHRSAGKAAVDRMLRLAVQGRGLATWIAREKPGFE